jgi:hypothetical protein
VFNNPAGQLLIAFESAHGDSRTGEGTRATDERRGRVFLNPLELLFGRLDRRRIGERGEQLALIGQAWIETDQNARCPGARVGFADPGNRFDSSREPAR